MEYEIKPVGKLSLGISELLDTIERVMTSGLVVVFASGKRHRVRGATV